MRPNVYIEAMQAELMQACEKALQEKPTCRERHLREAYYEYVRDYQGDARGILDYSEFRSIRLV